MAKELINNDLKYLEEVKPNLIKRKRRMVLNKISRQAGKYALAGTGIAGLVYGGKKLYDHYKNN